MNKTGVVWDPIYAQHVMSTFHPESPARITRIKHVLDETEAGKRTIQIKARPVTKEEIGWVHDKKYIDLVESTAGKNVLLDPDTTACPKTWEAACMAAGGVIEAVDEVVKGKIDNAYAFVRPPGHHAEHDRTMGFCFFNNIAIAAEYALKKLGIHRIAIIDFDIHHGNGTEHHFYKRSDVFYISTHRWPFYPGTGNRTDHGQGLGTGHTLNIPLMKGDNEEFKDAYESVVLPVLEEYRPELILVSAGYDAHLDDPMGGFRIETDTYNWLTKKLVEISKKVCGGKIIFVLEGGYSTDALAECVEGALNILEET